MAPGRLPSFRAASRLSTLRWSAVSPETNATISGRTHSYRCQTEPLNHGRMFSPAKNYPQSAPTTATSRSATPLRDSQFLFQFRPAPDISLRIVPPSRIIESCVWEGRSGRELAGRPATKWHSQRIFLDSIQFQAAESERSCPDRLELSIKCLPKTFRPNQPRRRLRHRKHPRRPLQLGRPDL